MMITVQEFLPLLLARRPPAEAEALRAAVARSVDALKAWVGLGEL